MGISVGIITFNEEKKLSRTLMAVKDIAEEIIIVDSHSKDSTVEIAKKFGAKVFVEDWKGYGEQKNSVIKKCKNEWILLIDADEEISVELKKDLENIADKKSDYDVYEVNFTNVCFGKKIKYGGWSNMYRIRFFRNGSGLYNNEPVHEEYITDKKIGRIKSEIYHYSYENIEEYMKKFDRYTSEGALKRYKKGKKASFFDILYRPYIKFLKMYVFRLGILDGYEGYLLAKLSYFYNFMIYTKLRELIKNEKNNIF